MEWKKQNKNNKNNNSFRDEQHISIGVLKYWYKDNYRCKQFIYAIMNIVGADKTARLINIYK